MSMTPQEHSPTASDTKPAAVDLDPTHPDPTPREHMFTVTIMVPDAPEILRNAGSASTHLWEVYNPNGTLDAEHHFVLKQLLMKSLFENISFTASERMALLDAVHGPNISSSSIGAYEFYTLQGQLIQNTSDLLAYILRCEAYSMWDVDLHVPIPPRLLIAACPTACSRYADVVDGYRKALSSSAPTSIPRPTFSYNRPTTPAVSSSGIRSPTPTPVVSSSDTQSATRTPVVEDVDDSSQESNIERCIAEAMEVFSSSLRQVHAKGRHRNDTPPNDYDDDDNEHNDGDSIRQKTSIPSSGPNSTLHPPDTDYRRSTPVQSFRGHVIKPLDEDDHRSSPTPRFRGHNSNFQHDHRNAQPHFQPQYPQPRTATPAPPSNRTYAEYYQKPPHSHAQQNYTTGGPSAFHNMRSPPPDNRGGTPHPTQPPFPPGSPPSTPPPVPPPPSAGTTSMLQTLTWTYVQYMAGLRIEMDTNKFVKATDVPKQGLSEPLCNWYRRFVVHGSGHGIFIPPYESLIEDDIMGSWHPYLPPEKTLQIHSMGSAIHAALNRENVFPKNSSAAETALTTPNGYHALYSIIRSDHPKLNHQGSPSFKPLQRPEESFMLYVGRIRTYALAELAADTIINDNNLISLIINNCHSTYRSVMKTRLLPQLRSLKPSDPFPACLHIDQIARTMALEWQLHGDQQPNNRAHIHRPTGGHIRQVVHADDTPPDDDLDLLIRRIIANPRSCFLCGQTDHLIATCPLKPSALANTPARRPSSRPQGTSRNQTAVVHHLDKDDDESDNNDDTPPNNHDDGSPHEDDIAPVHHVTAVSPHTSDFDTDFDLPLTHCNDAIFLSTPGTLGHETVAHDCTSLGCHLCINAVFHDDADTGTPAHVDGGSAASTTNQLELLWNYTPYSGNFRLRDAGGVFHFPKGIGYLKVPTKIGYYFAETFYTPTLMCTILSPAHLDRTGKYIGYNIEVYKDAQPVLTLRHRLRRCEDLYIPMREHGGLTWTRSLSVPTTTEHTATLSCPSLHDNRLSHTDFDAALQPSAAHVDHDTTSPQDSATLYIHHLNRDALRILWHQRLGHIHHRRISELHNYVTGIPKIDLASDMDKCPTCMAAKATRSSRSTDDSRQATICNQGLSIDFGFIVQQSQDSTRYNRYLGLNKQTCYVLVADHYSGTLYGGTFVTKSPPLNWLNRWLALHTPDCPNKYVRFDQGGELAKCAAIRNLFQVHGYDVEFTGADNSRQNGLVERPHRTIGDALRALLHGGSLDYKFWPWAFQHFIRLSNVTPHAGRDATPHETCHGIRPDLSLLRTFGCRVYVRPPGRRPAKLSNHVDKGIFLGYHKTLKNIVYYDLSSKQIKVSSHARFDEGMNDLTTLPPNAEYLIRAQRGDGFPSETIETPAMDLTATTNPFSVLVTEAIKVVCNHPTFGFQLDTCHHRHRVITTAFLRDSSANRIRNATRRYRNAFLVEVNNIPVFSIEDALAAFLMARTTMDLDSITVVLSPERAPSTGEMHSPYAFGIDQLRCINALTHGTGEVGNNGRLDELSDDELNIMVAALSSTVLGTSSEQALGSFTRRKLLKLETWPEWQQAEATQLDDMNKQGMYGEPCLPPPGAVVLRQHWMYSIKSSGKRKARNCCDGSRRAAPQLRDAAQTYASCVDQPCMRLFFALTAAEGMITYSADATNAYANSPAPATPTYVRIDDAYADWYMEKYGKAINRSFVLPVLHALQGHPEAGALWEKTINGLLADYGFRSTTHEKSIYTTTIQGQKVLLCRQVDDLAVACVDPTICQSIIKGLAEKFALTDDGILSMFNGVDIEQSKDYVRLSCRTYIKRMLESHGWEKGSVNESESDNIEPLPDAMSKTIDTTQGPEEHTDEAKRLIDKYQFSYRSVLGELIYAYVAGRLDIGYAITKLARHSQSPAEIHYDGLKRVCRYLRKTMDWGIVYWRPRSVNYLQPGTFQRIVPSPANVPVFPPLDDPFRLVGFVDAAYGTDVKTRRSVTGVVFTLCGAAIAFRSKLQTTVATSSTEAEFIAAVQAAKMAKYLRSVLNDLGYPQVGATILHEDNEAAILMTNAGKPTQRSRHIDIQHYALQEWKQKGEIMMVHIPGVINPADALTKALGWILHHRHVRRVMGHYTHT